MALWDLSEISTDLWLDASATSTRTVDVGLSDWADKKTNGLSVSQADSSSQPSVISSGLNGLDVIRFDGADDFLSGGDILDTGVDSFSIFIVGKISVYNAIAAFYAKSRYAILTGGRYAFYIETSVLGAIIDLSDDGSKNILASYAYSDTGYHIFSQLVDRSSGTIKLLIDGIEVASNTFTPDSFTQNNSSRFLVGAYPNATDSGQQGYLNGDICEVAVVLSTVDYQKIVGYLAWKWGLEDNLASGHPYKSVAPRTGLEILATISQPYLLEGTLRVPMSQDYALTVALLSSCSQLYGLQLLAKLIQYYGNAPVFSRILEQWYGSAAILRRAVEQPYADAKAMAAVLDQEWIGYGDLLAMLQQRYSISQGQLQAMAEQAYTIQERAILQRLLDQLYITAPRDALVQRPAITVATADGEALDPHHISIEHDEGDLSVRAEIHLASQEQYLLCRHLETRVIITVDAEQWTLLVEAPSASRPAPGEESFVVPLVSPAVLLDAPYADTVDEEYTGMASAIVGGLAASAVVAVVWQLLDWYIPAGVLFANGETPLAVIRKIVAAVGGILQASPAGELICRPAYPLPVTSWATATPAAYLTDMDNFYSVTSSPEIRDGYNRYLVSDQDAATAGLTLENIEVDAQTKKIRVYQVPYDAAADIRLRTSGGAWVSIAADGTIDESLTELVEIVAGEGNCQHPIYSLASRSYKQRALGTITIAEDGHLRTEIADNSLVEIVYTTRYRQFTVRSPQIEDVQFYPEEVAA